MNRFSRTRPRRLRRILAAGVLLASTLSGATAADVLQVTGSLWPPYMDSEQPEGGLAADLVRTALERAGYQIEPNIETWSRAYQGTAVGVYDVVAAIWQNEARSEELLFSDAYLLNDLVFMARRGVAVEYRDLLDLLGEVRSSVG